MGTLMTMVAMLLSIVMVFLAIFGYGWNIYKLCQTWETPLSGMVVCRIIGIFIPPLGIFMGFL